jgi:hypothetical protein
MSNLPADVYCISESWITRPDHFASYTYIDYLVFGSCRPHKPGGGVMILVNPLFRPTEYTAAANISLASDVYNICAVKLLNCKPQFTVVGVYISRNANCRC